LIAIFIFTSSCEEEVIDIQENNIIQKDDNSKQTDRQKINRLKANLKYRVKAYNFKHGKNHFIKKYGGLDLENHISFRFKEIDDNFIVVIPFKKNKYKNKVLIAYYKNNKVHYKVVNKKNYSKKKEYAVSEKAFIKNLDVIFDMVYQNSNTSNKSIVNKAGNCYGIWMFNYGICTSVYRNSCTDAEFEIDTCGKGGDGEDEVDYDSNGNPIDPNNPFGDGGEILDGEATSYQDIDLGPDNSEPDTDPIDPTDPTDPNNPVDECDGLEFDCGTSGGSNDDPDDEACDPGKVKNTNGDCECPQGTVEDANGNCVSSNDATPCEMAFLARDVYFTEEGNQKTGTESIPSKLSGGWELNTTLNLSQLRLTDSGSGFNSAVYQKLVNGVYQYMYVTQGTNPTSTVDWATNFVQLLGISAQYDISAENAQILDEIVGEDSSLIFVGHSLGGGLASVNALMTGRTAYTYNAAGLSNATRDEYDAGLNPSIFATVVRGEILDSLQKKAGMQAESSWGINYVDYESKSWVDFLNRVAPTAKTYNQVRLHFMESVLKAMDCDE